MSHKTQIDRKAKLTGIETDGPSAGEVVCPMINLWAVNSRGERKKRTGKLAHGTEVKVDERTTNSDHDVLYRVISGSVKGWVTERFLIFED